MSVHFKEAGHWGHKGAKTCGSVDYVRTGSDAGSEGGDGWGEKRRRELGEKMEAAGQTARQMLEKCNMEAAILPNSQRFLYYIHAVLLFSTVCKDITWTREPSVSGGIWLKHLSRL